MAKKLAGHGKFGQWLETSCPDLSPRTARDYMTIAKNGSLLGLDDTGNRQFAADLKVAAALKLLAKSRR